MPRGKTVEAPPPLSLSFSLLTNSFKNDAPNIRSEIHEFRMHHILNFLKPFRSVKTVSGNDIYTSHHRNIVLPRKHIHKYFGLLRKSKMLILIRLVFPVILSSFLFCQAVVLKTTANIKEKNLCLIFNGSLPYQTSGS